MPRSTFYYRLKLFGCSDKYAELKNIINKIFTKNKSLYGYRRITAELNKRGIFRNHKLVSRLMKECGLICKIKSGKYHSYKGEVGKIADNVIDRDFSTTAPLQRRNR